MLVLGGMQDVELTSSEQQFLEQICDTLLQSLLLSHQRARLKAVRARVVDKTDFLQHQVRSRLVLLQSAIRSLTQAEGHQDEISRALETTHEQLRAVHHDLAEVCHRASMPGFSLTNEKQLDWQAIQLEPVIAAATDQLEAHAADRDTDLRIDSSIGHLPIIEGDPFRLRLVFYQLLNNAVKYSRGHAEGRRRWVAITGSHSEGHTCVAIENFGRGIQERDLERIFDKGVRLLGSDDRRSRFDKRKGYGYGLYECRQIIRAHGGRIWATSRHYTGARVTSARIDSCITTLSVELPLDRQGGEVKGNDQHPMDRG